METGFKLHIRHKILLGILFLLTVAVGVITFTMANLFHEDKKAYINDLAATVALTTAEETQSLLVGYMERLNAYARIMRLKSLDQENREKLLKGFFSDFPDLVAVYLYEDGERIGAVHDPELLALATLSAEDLSIHREENPLPIPEILGGEVFIENSTLVPSLPVMTLAMAAGGDEGNSPAVVSAIIRLDRLQEVARRSKSYEVFLLDFQGAVLAHRDPGRVAQRSQPAVADKARDAAETPGAGLIREYVLDDIEMIGGFISLDFCDVMVAVQIPKSAAYLASRDLLDRLLVVALALLAAAAIGSLVWASGISRPVEHLWAATREIAKGDFNVHVKVSSKDEIGTLAGAFNDMVSELKERETALKEAHNQLIQSEKLAAFGQLGAGIAHEVKNPMTGILGCAQLALSVVDHDSEIRRDLELIEKETIRCREIIENLLRFARQEKAVFEPTDINEVIEASVSIVRHQLELNDVKLHSQIEPDLPLVNGNGNQLQQVLMNLLMNAQQAMEGESGRISLTSKMDTEHRVEIRISDSGPGISRENLERLFEPFFTTKPGGKGTGLGLSVSFGIVKEHHGEIIAESRPGEGASFTIKIPSLEANQMDAAESMTAGIQ